MKSSGEEIVLTFFEDSSKALVAMASTLVAMAWRCDLLQSQEWELDLGLCTLLRSLFSTMAGSRPPVGGAGQKPVQNRILQGLTNKVFTNMGILILSTNGHSYRISVSAMSCVFPR